MITAMNHTGFVVRDLDEAVEFYRDVVGLTVVATREREGWSISQVVGYEDAHLQIALLGAGNGHALELIQYVRPVGSARTSGERNTEGAAHLAFGGRELRELLAILPGRGGHGGTQGGGA